MSQTIGIDVGGTKIAAGRVEHGHVLDRRVVPTPTDAGQLVESCLELAGELAGPEVGSVGLGVAGLVRWPEGRLVWGPNLAVRDVPFRKLLEEGLQRPVGVDNDANAAALAEERYGAGRAFHHLLMVTLGTGIGGGIVEGGAVLRGWSFAGEVGHMVVDRDGPACPCGRRGCWEQLGSGTALARLGAMEASRDPEGAVAREAGGAEVRGEHVGAAAREGDRAALGLVEELAGWVGLGLANLISILDPEVIVIGGGLVDLGDLLLGPVRVATRRQLQGAGYRPETSIVAASLGEEAGIVGAALVGEEVAS